VTQIHRGLVGAGLGFGDEAKGPLVDFLCRFTGASLVVRYCGGPQAAHHVHNPANGKFHCFSQFGAGVFAGARTYLAPAMLVDLAASAASPIVKDRSNFLLGEICENRGDTRSAVRYYRAVVDAGTGGRLVDRAKERIEKLDASKRRR
jgi:hypothetical protein